MFDCAVGTYRIKTEGIISGQGSENYKVVSTNGVLEFNVTDIRSRVPSIQSASIADDLSVVSVQVLAHPLKIYLYISKVLAKSLPFSLCVSDWLSFL